MSEDTPAPRRQGRRRRANALGGRTRTHHSHRVLVTLEEEARLVALAEAQRVTVPRLLVEAALSGNVETPTRRHEAIVELFAVRRQLAGVASNVNQLARAANVDARLAVGSTAALAEVRVVVAKIDAALEGLAA